MIKTEMNAMEIVRLAGVSRSTVSLTNMLIASVIENAYFHTYYVLSDSSFGRVRRSGAG
ncbi:hypothetical protein [Cohnella herbarum]|uniref:Uncharacterized protein n=1 Tax=Cohnella herbarum TaxID=2728023 RepID=A0A7Z2VP53_9BACL|nr:hypothetical protein [Cohnella herbarum]QJD86697.1 hypothetical protein HH215_28340 [Cohnella herbarum]